MVVRVVLLLNQDKIIMNIDIKITNFELTDALTDFVNQKLGSLDSRVSESDGVVRCNVEIARISNHHKNGDVYKTSVDMRVGEDIYRAEVVGEDMYAVIDEVKEKMERSLLSGNKKNRSIARRAAAAFKRLIRR